MLTIFTPTYNRAEKLMRVYDSLCRQSDFQFEWLIVDDGSTDQTGSIVSKLLQEKRFRIRYCKQQNGGKHRAYNHALIEAKGDWFFCLDSDDWLPENAVSRILSFASSCRSDQFIVAYKLDEVGNRLSDPFPNIATCILNELSQRYHCRGEFSLVFPTALARQFPFPSFQNERFMTEAVIYDRISLAAEAVLFPEVLTMCEYQTDGLSANVDHLMQKNPAGFCLYYMQRIDMQTNLFKRLIMAGKYRCFCRFAGESMSEYQGEYPRLVSAAGILGLVFFAYYKLIRGF